VKANTEEMKAILEEIKIVMETGLEEVKAMDLEANPEEIDAVAEHQEVPNKEAAVETIGALEDQSGDQQLAVEYQNLQKRWNKDDVV
jgi:hypothetical protein